MKCLNCDQEMMNNLVQVKANQISYDICEACGSLWLDAGELDKMAFQVEGSIEFCSKDSAENAPGPAKKCQRCEDVALEKVSFIGTDDIVLDHCKNCGGFWLDGGELDLVNKELQSIMPVKGKGFSEFVNNAHLPYWHKRVRRKSSETDFTMNVPPVKGAELKSETTHACPGCKTNLNAYTVFGMEIEGCPKCRGIFLDKDELRKLKDKAQKGSWQVLRWLDDETEAIGNTSTMPSKRTCPKCDDTQMVSACFGESGIMIDWCPGCNGTWLDRDEFADIVKFLTDKLSKLTAADARKKVYEEIREMWNGPEDKLSEILDAKAAISALMNITVFEHPMLFGLMTTISKGMPS